jgi:hypothetical protein
MQGSNPGFQFAIRRHLYHFYMTQRVAGGDSGSNCLPDDEVAEGRRNEVVVVFCAGDLRWGGEDGGDGNLIYSKGIHLKSGKGRICGRANQSMLERFESRL